MTNKFRLSSRVFERDEENEKIEPHKIFFLSVEGNVTEKKYLEGLSANRVKLGINAIVDVEVLGRRKRDTNSAPQQVVELLEEYLRLREYGEESLIEEIPKEFVDAYGTEFIQKFLVNPDDVPRRQKNAFITDLMKIGYSSAMYKISEDLKDVVIPMAYLPKQSAWDALQEIANAGLCKVFIDRQDRINVRSEQEQTR